MTATADELQTERALTALTLGLRQAGAAQKPRSQEAETALTGQQAKTDAVVAQMAGFLAQREVSRLPGRRLQGALRRARSELARVRAERVRASTPQTPIDGVLSYYSNINDALIDATVALTRLSNDGELLRALCSLVALMRVRERESREHAVLSHSFALGEFAPGMYRYLVALSTEKSLYSASLQSFATSDQVAAYQGALQQSSARQSAGMRDLALAATEEGLTVDPNVWFSAQAATVHDLSLIEKDFARNGASDR